MTIDLKTCLSVLKNIQITRSDIIFWVMRHGNQADEALSQNTKRRIILEDLRRRSVKTFSTDFEGLFVRILVQVSAKKEEYRVGRIIGVELTDPYTGFSFDDSHHTRLLLRVVHDEALGDEQKRARRHKDELEKDAYYQLTTVSNKEFQLEEVKRWKMHNPESFKQVLLERNSSLKENLIDKVGIIKMKERVKLAQSNEIPIDPSSEELPSNKSPQSNCHDDNNRKKCILSQSTDHQETIDDFSQDGIVSQTEKLSVSQLMDSGLLEDLEREVEEEERQKHFVLPVNFSHLNITKCREIEKEILEYLECIKQSLVQYNTQCVVCMANDAVILLLPCKHKVLCRACGTKVHLCPMCRVPIREVFEPLQL